MDWLLEGKGQEPSSNDPRFPESEAAQDGNHTCPVEGGHGAHVEPGIWVGDEGGGLFIGSAE